MLFLLLLLILFLLLLLILLLLILLYDLVVAIQFCMRKANEKNIKQHIHEYLLIDLKFFENKIIYIKYILYFIIKIITMLIKIP
jgi:hypothetical protein